MKRADELRMENKLARLFELQRYQENKRLARVVDTVREKYLPEDEHVIDDEALNVNAAGELFRKKKKEDVLHD